MGWSDELAAKLRGGSAGNYDIQKGPRTVVHVFRKKKRRPVEGLRLPTPFTLSV